MYAVPVKCKTTLGYHTAYIGDSDSLAASEQAPKKSRACFVDLNENPSFTDIARCITARQDAGVGSHPRERSGVFQEIREGEHDGKFVLIVTDANGDVHHGVIRKLTPRECWRLQGFTNEQFNKVAALGFSDGRLYKMAGNAVSVPVISALGRRIKEIDAKSVGKEELCPIM